MADGRSPLRLGIDIGGTFTDLFLYDGAGVHASHKLLTTPADPSLAAVRGMKEIMMKAGVQPEALAAIVHGTTLVVNAITERKGAVTGLLATEGFSDIIDFGEERRYDAYDLAIEFPAPLVPRRLRREVRERVSATGRVLLEIERSDVLDRVAELISEGIQSLAVSFLHAYANPDHERRALAWIQEVFPTLGVSLSSAVCPEIREYPRTSTVVADAYVKPVTRAYLDRLVSGFRDLSFRGTTFMMVSDGGVAAAEDVLDFPIRVIESGPAAGAIASARWAAQRGLDQMIAFDMGGTTAKIVVIDGGRPTHAGHFEAARVRRFRPGSGLPLSIPSLRLVEIGSGGGSIARINQLGLLQVGPDSAGAHPGPACYGRGGQEATVTDADLCLGLLDPKFFLGGTFELDGVAATEAIRRSVADSLNLSTEAAAAGIYNVVSENMASAMRVHCAELGTDRRRYALLAFGGAGPLHATYLARQLQITRVIVPPLAGIWSAIGLVIAPPSVELTRSYMTSLTAPNWERIRDVFREMKDQALRLMARAGVEPPALTFTAMADMRYVGQFHEILVPLPDGEVGPEIAGAIRRHFETAYQQRYMTILDRDIEVLVWRLRAAAPPPLFDGVLPARPTDTPPGKRMVFSPLAGRLEGFAVYRRSALLPGFRLAGPAVVEEAESTTVLWPGDTGLVDPDGSLSIEVGAR